MQTPTLEALGIFAQEIRATRFKVNALIRERDDAIRRLATAGVRPKLIRERAGVSVTQYARIVAGVPGIDTREEETPE